MNRIFGALALAVMATIAPASAVELQSGLQVGDYPDAFHVTDVTGPSAGEPLCYRCRYGARPVVSIFARNMDDNVKKLIKQVDDVVGKHHDDDRMAAFVVLLSDEPQKHEDSLAAVAKEGKIKHTPLTTYKTSVGPRKYRIHEDAAVTVMMWVENDVKSNHAFADGKLNDAAIKQVIADTAKILN